MLSSPYRYAPKSRSSFQVSRVGACGTCSLSIDERGDFVDLLGLKFIPSTLYGQDFPPMTQKQANNSRRRSFSLMGRYASMLSTQPPFQRGETLCDLVISHRHTDGARTACQYAQFAGARDGGIQQVTLQHSVVLGHDWHYHHREF